MHQDIPYTFNIPHTKPYPSSSSLVFEIGHVTPSHYSSSLSSNTHTHIHKKKKTKTRNIPESAESDLVMFTLYIFLYSSALNGC